MYKMAYSPSYTTASNNDAKGGQFFPIGQMPSSFRKFKDSSFVHRARWDNRNAERIEADASRKDDLSYSVQKNLRRCSRRLSERDATGSGCILRDEQQTFLPSGNLMSLMSYQETRSVTYESFHGYCGYDSLPSNDHLPSNDFPELMDQYSGYGYPTSLKSGNVIRNHRRGESLGRCRYSSSNLRPSLDRPEGVASQWLSRSARKRANRRRSRRKSSDSLVDKSYFTREISEHPVQPNSEGPAGKKVRSHPSVSLSTPSSMTTDILEDRLHVTCRIQQTSSAKCVESETSNDRTVENFREVAPPFAARELVHRRPSSQTENAKSPEKTKKTPNPRRAIVFEEQRNSPSKKQRFTLPGKLPVFPVDAAKFFGHKKGNSRALSSVTSEQPTDKDRSSHEQGGVSSSRSQEKVASSPKLLKSPMNQRRESAQMKLGNTVTADTDMKCTIEEPSRCVDVRESNRVAERIEPSTPKSTSKHSGADHGDRFGTPDATTPPPSTLKPVRRPSPDLKPKALVKRGRRSAKKNDDNGRADKTSETPGSTRKLVQQTIDSFFSRSTTNDAARSSTALVTEHSSKPLDRKSRRGHRSGKKSSEEINGEVNQVYAPRLGAVRSIYQDENYGYEQPVVRLIPLHNELVNVYFTSLRNSLSAQLSSNAAARLAEVTPIPISTQKKTCESSTDPPSVRVTDPPSVRVTDPPSVRVTDPPSVRVTDPPSVRVTDPPSVRVTDPPSVRVTDPSPVRVTEKSSTRASSTDSLLPKDLSMKVALRSNRVSLDTLVIKDSAADKAVSRPSPGQDNSSALRVTLRTENTRPQSEVTDVQSVARDISSMFSRKSPTRKLERSPHRQLDPVTPRKSPRVAYDPSPSKKEGLGIPARLLTDVTNQPRDLASPLSTRGRETSRAAPTSVLGKSPSKAQTSAQTDRWEEAQAQRDEQTRVVEAKEAAKRHTNRHTKGRKVVVYCDTLDEHLERHPVQNEVPVEKWYKWLNPIQVRCLALFMLTNKEICLRYSLEAERSEEWEDSWMHLARNLNTVCYCELTKLNTGLRLTVSEWKALWLEMKAVLIKRLSAMRPEERVHKMGSLECLLFDSDLYQALVDSNGKCLGKHCPRMWCPGASVGVLPPTDLGCHRTGNG